MPHLSQTFMPEVANVPVARRFVRGALSDLGAQAAVATVQTLVSELATNAVLHARTSFTVRVTCDGGTVRVSVLDLSRVPARVRNYGTDATTGRGLRLIESLASCWGVDPCDDGKEIWFEVAADGEDDGAEIEAWTDAPDVEALLAQFDDGEETVVRALIGRRAAALVRTLRFAA